MFKQTVQYFGLKTNLQWLKKMEIKIKVRHK